MSPDDVAVSGPATNLFTWLRGSMRLRSWPVSRSSCITPPLPAGIQSESPETTAWNCGSQSPSEAVPGEVPRFGGGFQSVGTIQLGTRWFPCQTKCCSFQICRSHASGPQGNGVRDPGGPQERNLPPLFTEA